MGDQGHDKPPQRDVGTTGKRPQGAPTDAGKTSGGGSLGHAPTDDVLEQTRIRNNATGREDDTVMPADDATLKTKI